MKTSIRINSALERGTIESGTKDLEDYCLASATMEKVRSGKEKVYPARDVRSDLGLDEHQSPKASLRG
jgi:RHH-type rel operon transcriptional repressor/antitoxin RelB